MELRAVIIDLAFVLLRESSRPDIPAFVRREERYVAFSLIFARRGTDRGEHASIFRVSSPTPAHNPTVPRDI